MCRLMHALVLFDLLFVHSVKEELAVSLARLDLLGYKCIGAIVSQVRSVKKGNSHLT